MAGFLAHRSALLAAFLEAGPRERHFQWHVGHQLPADSCGYSPGFAPGSLLATD